MQRRCALLLLCLAAGFGVPGQPLTAQTFTSLFSFDQSNGSYPGFNVSLVQGLDGNLYATASSGGAYNDGTVFRISPSGAFNLLYSFCAQANCTDGQAPLVGLDLGIDGSFYGTARYGDYTNPTCPVASSCGTLFKITRQGTLTTLYDLCSQTGCTDGYSSSALVQGSGGLFYGTTTSGGGKSGCPAGCGTVYSMTPGSTLTTLSDFSGSIGYDASALVQGRDGNFYGTTSSGGTHYHGTVFKVSPTGSLTTLYNFCASKTTQWFCLDGATPTAGVIEGSDGNFYGTTNMGGSGAACNDPRGCGTFFKITPEGSLTTLYNFCSEANCTDGWNPSLPLMQATDGKFYGAITIAGMKSNLCAGYCGTIFQITPAGKLTTLYEFCSQTNCADGKTPAGGLVQATDGNFYGATMHGGSVAPGFGTVYRLSVSLAPFVKTLPTAAKVGTAVRILGTNLAGATSVSFHGTAATFTVISKSQIKTTVPAGATTGTVTVTTPSGTLNSNVAFQVLP